MSLAALEAPRSEAPSLPRHYPGSPVIWTSPTPTSAVVPRTTLRGATSHRTWASHVARSTFRPCSSHVPRWTLSPANVGCFGDRCQPSPFVRRVGVHGTTFEACLGFTRVRARTIANLSARQCTQGFNGCVTADVAWVATEAHRQILGWNSHPLVLRTFSWRTDKVLLICVLSDSP